MGLYVRGVVLKGVFHIQVNRVIVSCVLPVAWDLNIVPARNVVPGPEKTDRSLAGRRRPVKLPSPRKSYGIFRIFPFPRLRD